MTTAGERLDAALAAEADAYRGLLAGRDATADLVRARDAYLASHDLTGPASWGRLLGALKMAVLAGAGERAVAERALGEAVDPDSPASAYVRALAQVVVGGAPAIDAMLAAGGSFARTGRALAALAAGDGPGYAAALDDIVADFAARDAHLSGVAVADTALVLERLAADRGIAARPASPLVP